jgi:DNA polymerase III subunit delta'
MAFSQFPEQQQVTQLLQRSLERGRLGHGYLFSGEDLQELEGVARTLAKTVNCLEPVRSGPEAAASDCCDRCLNCHKIEGLNHPDVQWVRPESKSRVVTIDQIRQLMQTVNLKASEGAYKVAVIVAADRLNVQAANAFLKTLEEPPPRSVIVLLTTETQRVLETIQSRCLRLNFAGGDTRKFGPDQLAWLETFSSVAASGQKGLFQRYRLLDAMLARLSALKSETEKGLTARSPLERYEDVDPRLKERWEDELEAAIEAEYRRQRAEVLTLVQYWMRDVWLQTWSAGSDYLHFPQLKSISETISGRITAEEGMENLQVLEQTQRLLGSNVQEALALEVGLLRLKM